MGVMCTYFWRDGNGYFRSKYRVVDEPLTPPDWSYDGSSTGDAEVDCSDVGLKVVRTFGDPSMQQMFVYCVPEFDEREQIPSDRGIGAWVSFEQEFFLLKEDEHFLPDLNGPSDCYCGTGEWIKNRRFVESYLALLMSYRIPVSGANAEVSNYQWEYQVGPMTVPYAAATLEFTRFLLEYTSEQQGLNVVWIPKPYLDCNGSGCHVNFSTEKMRTEGNPDKYMAGLATHHAGFIDTLGEANKHRLCGKCETAHWSEFTYAHSARDTSVRIPPAGTYYEDRRPGSNCDPLEVVLHHIHNALATEEVPCLTLSE